MPRERIPVGGIGKITVTRTNSGRWQAFARCRDDDGIRRTIRATADTKTKARNKLVAQHIARIPPTSGRLTRTTRVSVAAQKWLEQIENGQLKSGSVTAYKRSITNHISPEIGELSIGELTASRVQAFIDKTAKASGATTAKVARGVLSQVMDMCVRDDALPTNPVISTRPPKITRNQVHALTPRDVQRIRAKVTAWGNVKAPGPPRNAPLLLDFLDVLAGTGLRPGEALALRWADVDLRDRTLSVSGTVVRAHGKLIRQESPKTATSARTVSLPGFVVMVLSKRRLREGSSEGPVFASRVGGWIEASNLQRLWSSARGDENVTFRDYRKAVATLIRRAEGMDAAAAQLGHSSPEITRRHYVERDGRVDFAEVVERMSS